MHTVASQSIFRREDGQTMSEYAIVLALVTLACVATIGFISSALISRFGTVLTTIRDIVP